MIRTGAGSAAGAGAAAWSGAITSKRSLLRRDRRSAKRATFRRTAGGGSTLPGPGASRRVQTTRHPDWHQSRRRRPAARGPSAPPGRAWTPQLLELVEGGLEVVVSVFWLGGGHAASPSARRLQHKPSVLITEARPQERLPRETLPVGGSVVGWRCGSFVRDAALSELAGLQEAGALAVECFVHLARVEREEPGSARLALRTCNNRGYGSVRRGPR